MYRKCTAAAHIGVQLPIFLLPRHLAASLPARPPVPSVEVLVGGRILLVAFGCLAARPPSCPHRGSLSGWGVSNYPHQCPKILILK